MSGFIFQLLKYCHDIKKIINNFITFPTFQVQYKCYPSTDNRDYFQIANFIV